MHKHVAITDVEYLWCGMRWYAPLLLYYSLANLNRRRWGLSNSIELLHKVGSSFRVHRRCV